MTMTMTTENKNDLDWLAFCYTAGELNAVDAEQFEARLADDQRAREALARAVQLTQTVAAAETQFDLVMPARRTESDWKRRVSWMAIGGLASLLVALLWSGLVGPTWHSRGVRVRSWPWPGIKRAAILRRCGRLAYGRRAVSSTTM